MDNLQETLRNLVSHISLKFKEAKKNIYVTEGTGVLTEGEVKRLAQRIPGVSVAILDIEEGINERVIKMAAYSLSRPDNKNSHPGLDIITLLAPVLREYREEEIRNIKTKNLYSGQVGKMNISLYVTRFEVVGSVPSLLRVMDQAGDLGPFAEYTGKHHIDGQQVNDEEKL